MQTIGTHIILDGYEVQADFDQLDVSDFLEFVRSRIRSSDMTILGENFYDFENPKGAFTYMILLGESHFSIHTFPEEQKITCDIYSCNISRDFSGEMRACMDGIVEYLKIGDPRITELAR